MSKSKKYYDPENIIKDFGADAARLYFIHVSEKDIQWSEEGITSSFKFIQKLWNLNSKILEEIKKNHTEDTDENFEKYTNKYLKMITKNLENFSYNKIIANLYEMYSYINDKIKKPYSKKTLVKNYEKILISMIPIIPHFSNECLSVIE